MKVLEKNLENLFEQDILHRHAFMRADVCENVIGSKFDTILMNPPFGTKNNQGIESEILMSCFEINPKVIYSLHKATSEDYLVDFANIKGYSATKMFTVEFKLTKMYSFHKHDNGMVLVSLFKFVKKVLCLY